MNKNHVSNAVLMQIGEAVHGGMKPTEACRHFNFAKSTIYRGLRHYEKKTGHRLIGPSTVQKAAMKRAGAAIPAIPNANGTAIAAISDNWQRRALEAEARETKLRDELEHATDEAHTLQKIIITLGRAL